MAVEYFEYAIDENPEEEFPRIEEGENVQFRTRDPILNELEQQIQDEGRIDAATVLSTFSENDRAALAKRLGIDTDLGEEFSDKYDEGNDG